MSLNMFGVVVRSSVKEFSETFQDSNDLETYLTLIEEEAKEVVEAGAMFSVAETHEDQVKAFAALLKEVMDAYYVMDRFQMIYESDPKELSKDTEDRLTKAGSLAGPLIQKVTSHITEDDAVEAMLIVHNSNMSKVDPLLGVLRREDGKVLKGSGYKPADLVSLVCRIQARSDADRIFA